MSFMNAYSRTRVEKDDVLGDLADLLDHFNDRTVAGLESPVQLMYSPSDHTYRVIGFVAADSAETFDRAARRYIGFGRSSSSGALTVLTGLVPCMR